MRYPISEDDNGCLKIEPSFMTPGKMYQAKFQGKEFLVTLEKDAFKKDVIHFIFS